MIDKVHSGATAQTLLTGLANPGAEARRVMSVLINDVLETLLDPFALVLDDLHLIIEQAIFAALDYLLEPMPPQMHLVVASRRDPPLVLARLRARGQVAELRFTALRFTVEQATAFLNDCLGLDLSPDNLAVLQARTEGWWVSTTQPDALYRVVRVTPSRIDLIDEDLGWGVQETLE